MVKRLLIILLCLTLLTACKGITNDSIVDSDEKEQEDIISESEFGSEVENENKEIEKPVEYFLFDVNDDREYPVSEKLSAIVKVDDFLYYVRKRSDLNRWGGYKYQLCGIRENGTGWHIAYESPPDQLVFPKIMKFGNDKILLFFEIKYEGLCIASLDLPSSEVTHLLIYNKGICYRDKFYYIKDRSGELKVMDVSFSSTLLIEDVIEFDISRDRIIYCKKPSVSSSSYPYYSWYTCDLKGRDIKEIKSTALDPNFGVYDGVIYSYNYGFTKTRAFDLFAGETTDHEPVLNTDNMQFHDEYFFARDLLGNGVYRIGNDWTTVEVIAEYYCELNLIGDYLYLAPYYGSAMITDSSFKEFSNMDAIYRIKHDGSNYERFVETGDFTSEYWLRHEYIWKDDINGVSGV